MPRLQKFLADAGIGSRRHCEELVKSGQVLVNGKIATIGCTVQENDEVIFQNKKIVISSSQDRIIMLNKPLGAVVSNSSKESDHLAIDYLPKEASLRWISIGRLDINSTGLLLFTNNGKLANLLGHPSSGFDREYLVRARGTWNSKKKEIALKGLKIDEELLKFSDIYEHDKKNNASNIWFTVCLMTGRNREVRKIFNALDMQVNRLKRVRFGPIFLADKLREGAWRELTNDEIIALKNYASENI
ncbi:MAG: pseudouridine synthase [Gammaproteobacteria bacterium]